MEILFLVIIGVAAGILAGLMGIGGGIIFSPVLFFLFEKAGVEHSVTWSVASGLFCTLVAAGSSAIRQAIARHLFLAESIKLGIFGAIGITAGKLLLTSPYYNRTEFVLFFSALLLYTAYLMFRRGRDTMSENDREFTDLKAGHAFVTGGIGGFVASLAGVGGGGIMVPIMNLFYKQPFRKTVSISQLGMVIMVSVGVIQLALSQPAESGITGFHLGYVDFGAALPLSMGGLVGAYAGAYFNHRINRKYLQWGFAILATIMATRLIWGII